MKDELDFSMFDEEPSIPTDLEEADNSQESNDLDLSMFDNIPEEETEIESVEQKKEIPREAQSGRELTNYVKDEDPTKMGIGEAAITGFGKGTSFGLTPIVSGLVGAGSEVIEDIGDSLGLTQDEELRDQGFKIEDDYKGWKGLVKKYYDLRDAQKRQEDKAYEDQAAVTMLSELAGGVTSGIGTSGMAAKAMPQAVDAISNLNLAKKVALGSGMGAGGQAVSQFGQGSEKLFDEETGKITEQTIGNVLDETTDDLQLGALIGGGLPLAGGAIKKGKDAISSALEGTEFKTIYDFTKQYGKAAAKELSQARQQIAGESLESIKKSISDSALEKKGILKDLVENINKKGTKFDITKNLRKTVDKLRGEVRKQNIIGEEAAAQLKLADDLENTFMRLQKAEAELMRKVESDIAKRSLKSRNKQASAIKKAEGKAVMDAEKSGSELEMLTDKNLKYQDVAELPYDTPKGEIRGVDAKLKDRFINPDTGEEFIEYRTKKFRQDTTPFQNTKPVITQEGDNLVARYTDEATGEIFETKLPYSQEAYSDLSKLAPEDLIEKYEAYSAQVMQGRPKDSARHMYEAIDPEYQKIISETKIPEIDENIARQEDILDIFKTDKDLLKREGVDLSKKGSGEKYAEMIENVKNAPTLEEKITELDKLTQLTPKEKVGLLRGITSETQDVTDLTTSGLFKDNPGMADDIKKFQQLTKAQDIVEGKSGASGFSKVGLKEKATLYGAKTAAKTSRALNNMAPEELNQFKNWLSRQKGGKGKFAELLNTNKKEQAIFSLSQQPGFRTTFDEYQQEMERRKLEE